MASTEWFSRVCQKCGEEISLLGSDLRKNCDDEGNLTIRCPICKQGLVKFTVPD